MLDRFSAPARQALAFAEDDARILKHEYTGTGHLLLGLLRRGNSSAARVLESLGISLEGARAQLVSILGVGEESSFDQKGLTPRAKLVLELALREAHRVGDEEVATHHILLALWRENAGVGAGILLGLGADYLANELLERSQRPRFEAEVADAVGAIEDSWATAMTAELERTVDAWFDDALALLPEVPETAALSGGPPVR